jgi:hypothetical protein
VAFEHFLFWILEREYLMIELENLKVAVAMFVEEVMVCGFRDEFGMLLVRIGEEVVLIGVKKGGLEMGLWR